MTHNGGEGPRMLVVGCGGIGGIVAASLLHQRRDVTVLTRNELVVDAINSAGIRTRGEQSLGTVPAEAHTQLPTDVAPFDYILLCTQPPELEEAARSLLPHLDGEGAMVVFQNGLCEPRIAELAGPERVIGAIVAWGSTMSEPGIYDRTSAGGFTLGRLGSSVTEADDKLPQLSTWLEAIGPVSLTDDLLGARWSKLAINCAITSLGAIGGDRLGVLLRRRSVRRLALEIMTEAVEVARAEGIALRKIAGTIDLDWLALTTAEKNNGIGSASLVAKHALLLAVGTRFRRLRSSMLNAIERGRTPAIDFLNGEVVQRGAQHGLPTPVNEMVRDMVWQIARGELLPGPECIEQLWAATRAAPRPADGSAAPTPAPTPGAQLSVSESESESEPESVSVSEPEPEPESESEPESVSVSEPEPEPKPDPNPVSGSEPS